MKEYIIDEKTGIEYKLVGDYYLPMIKAPDVPEIGIWGQRYIRYLKENRRAYYTALLLSGKLFDQAAAINQAAEELYNRLIKEIALREEVTEELKKRDQMEWIRSMNSIRNRVEEVITEELIYS